MGVKATSQDFGTSNKYIKYRIVVEEGDYNILTNSSPTTVIVQAWRTNTGYETWGSGYCYVNINGSPYSQKITTSQKLTYLSYTEIFRRTIDIPHNDDGSKTLWISSYIEHDVITSESQGFEVVLTTIPRASTPSITGDLLLGSEITIDTNRVSDNFKHCLYFSWGSQISNKFIEGEVDGSTTWTIPKDLADHIPNGTSGTLFIICETYKDGSLIGTKTINATVEVPNTEEFNPIISEIALSEAIDGLFAKYEAYIQNQSKAYCTIAADGAYSSQIASYKAVVNGTIYNEKDFTTDFLKLAGTNSVAVTVTDTRGRTATLTREFEVSAYDGPTITKFIANRCTADGVFDDEGEFAKIDITATIPSLNNKNDYSYYFQYRDTDVDEYTSYHIELIETRTDETITISGSFIIEADGNNAFDYMFAVADGFIPRNKLTGIDTVFQLMNFNSSGRGMAIGKVSEKENALEINMPIYDQFGQLIPNGFAEYKTGDVDIDPNTTLSHLILTETNTPNENGFYYIMTLFYASKDINNSRTQIAFPYIYDIGQNKREIFIRQNVNGTWNEWTQI